MAVSIRDVAEAAGVSPTTVSHVLSGHRPVAGSTARKVRETMERLGYSPMWSARNLALGRTQLIGVLVPDIANAFFAELAKGIEKQAVANGYHVVLGNTGYSRDTSLQHLELVRSRAVDGVVYAAGSAFNEKEILEVLGELPLVLVDEVIADSSVPLVTSDNVAGGAMAARYLHSLGHRGAMVLAGPVGLQTSESRVDGFCKEWQMLDGSAPQVVNGEFTIAGGRAALRERMDAIVSGEITAIFAVNDEMAFGAMRECLSSGMRIPEDVSVIGFDDVPASALVSPPLTTLRQNVAAMGEIACQCLMNGLRSADRQSAEPIRLPVSLVERESCGSAPDSPRQLERSHDESES